MSSIKKRPDGRWRARYRDDAGKEHSRHFTRKVDAQRWLDSVTVAVANGTYADPRSGKVPFAVVADEWFDTRLRWSESTRARNRSILDRHVLPAWRDRKLNSIQPAEIQKWIGELSRSGLSGRSVRKIAGVLSAVLAYAVAPSRRLGVSPYQGIELPSHTMTPRRYLSHEQVEALAANSEGHEDIVYTLAYTGLRIGELAALRVRHADLLRRRLIIEESVTEVNGVLTWSTPKDKERRTVPLPGFIVDMLAIRLDGKAPDDMLFGSDRGDVLRVRNMRRDWFDAAAVDAGVAGLTPHELRHTAASLAVQAGASVLAVQRMLGHEKASTTLDVYSDLFDADLDDVADGLSAARERALADFLRTEPVTELPTSRSAGR